jgi:urease accessory protein
VVTLPAIAEPAGGGGADSGGADGGVVAGGGVVAADGMDGGVVAADGADGGVVAAGGAVTAGGAGGGAVTGGGVVAAGGAGGRLARNRLTAAAVIEAVAGPDGTTRLPVIASEVPLVLRRTPSAVYLVGGAAGPIGGDELRLRITVGAGAVLRMRSAAASIALPGLDGSESVLRVSVSVAAGGRLEYLPEPVVVSAGARHATLVSVTLAAGASLAFRDELLLGRHGEAGGSARTELRVDYAGRPLLRQSLSVSGTDPAALGPAVLAGHRAVGSLLLVDGAAADERGASQRGVCGGPSSPHGDACGARDGIGERATPERAVMRLAGPGVLVTALADDAVTLRQRLRPGAAIGP